MAKQKLRAVGPDETAPVRPKTVTEAAENGTARDLLVAMRDRVAKDVENPNTPARDLAALTRRLMEITKEIELIDAKAEQESEEGEATADESWDASAI